MKLPSEIESIVQALTAAHGGMGRVEFLDLPRLVPDYVEKAIVFTRQAQPAFLVMIAPAAYPACVRDAFARAADARVALGSGLTGAAVQVAVHQGVVAGKSFAVVPYLTPLRRGRLGRRWDRFRLRRPVFAWLCEVTRRTVVVPPEETRIGAFRTPLLALSQFAVAGDRIRSAARESLAALDAGRWKPLWVLAHNDLWIGNVMRRPHGMDRGPGFSVIDWGSSSVHGHPAYDFISFARSIGLHGDPLRRELRAYCAALGSDPSHARHYLMGALGALSLTLGEWPKEQFAATALSVLDLMDSTAIRT